MIPKIIHYCWFGKGLMPHSQKRCIEGWKKLMPDYTIMRWDESTFDLDAHPLAKYACEVKKYALASDVCRYNVLSEYGGIYLDTDVEVFERFDEFLDYNFFSGIELYNEFFTEGIQEKYLNADGSAKEPDHDLPRLEILTSSMACERGLPMIDDIRDYYESLPASADFAFNYRQHVNNDRLVARYLTKYGFKYKDETQLFGDGMIVFGTGTFGHAFCPNEKFRVSYHHNAATWEQERWNRTQRISYFFDKIGLLPVYKEYKRIKKKIKKRLMFPVVGEIWCLHRVVPNRSAFKSNRDLEITPDFLEGLIKEYQSKGFRFVGMDSLLSEMNACFKKKLVSVSFDDGFSDVYTYAFPILKKYSIPFTLYLTTDFANQQADIWWLQLEKFFESDEDGFEKNMKDIYDSNQPMAQYMHEITNSLKDSVISSYSITWAQIREMIASGLCTIGSHTVSHPGFSRINETQEEFEIAESKRIIEEELGVTVSHFSFPHSMTSHVSSGLLKKHGYKSAALGYGGSVHKGDDVFRLCRKYIIQE